MALILRGKSKCAVCGQTIQADDEATGLPHFADGPADVHWRFSDAPFHLSCYLNLPEQAEIEARVAGLHQRSAESKQATQNALLDAWCNATDVGDERVPRTSDWIEEFAWYALGRKSEDGWRFTQFGIEQALALDASDHQGTGG
ncbi:MAG TPA: hypothetical protein VH063_08255 [Gaiellaceae bacterium]|jgi:hypothetical protein|nr:hypothetical protein [Gaiellaceae bacterium]